MAVDTAAMVDEEVTPDAVSVLVDDVLAGVDLRGLAAVEEIWVNDRQSPGSTVALESRLTWVERTEREPSDAVRSRPPSRRRAPAGRARP